MKFSIGRLFDYKKLLKELENGLRKLDFRYNFNSTIVEVTFSPLEEKIIKHSLKKVPNYYIIGGQDVSGQIINGTQNWTRDTISLKNSSNNTITSKIIILE